MRNLSRTKSICIYNILLFTAIVLCSFNNAKAQSISRNILLQQELNTHKVREIKSEQISFPPLQKAPVHIHTCPVVGYIVTGKCLLQIEGEEEKILNEGDAFFEPANKKILHFDNLSESDSLIFTAFYLINKEDQLVKLVKSK
ncbi:cupin domain-containing protein [Chondrinema litorale]|uniref:cupin domain-containing protein n=1 Tax=Chondrinema litorale TaxID=2994555 RepID=UPI002543CCB6|nr:cupin domain-containing protein [Chondrinema litorale]UZR93481.1 cupin domain-containing protein [Chondrinema litorale]